MNYRGYSLETAPDGTVAVYWLHEPRFLVEEFPSVAAAKAAVDEWHSPV